LKNSHKFLKSTSAVIKFPQIIFLGIINKNSYFFYHDHLRGLVAFEDEYKTRRRILVTRDPKPGLYEGKIEILPWRNFFEDLWSKKIMR
jgi:hypothetical protein